MISSLIKVKATHIRFAYTPRPIKRLHHCTVVNKGIIIEILDFELGAFSENLKHLMTWKTGIFGFSLQKKKF